MNDVRLSGIWATVRVDKADPHPIYAQIASRIEALLRRGVVAPSTALPPERLLARQLGVSRMTLRQAYDVLERAGLIECQRGRGTFVSARHLEKQQQEMRSFTEEIRARGAVPSSKLISMRTAKPGLAARDFFGIPETEEVYEIERVRLADATPVSLEKVEIPCYLCPGLTDFDLARQSLYRILEQHYGLELARCVEEISAAQPNRVQRQLLDVPRSSAVLVVRRKAYTTNDTPAELAVTAYRGDLYHAMVRSVRTR
jgi:GntR family transcriptional regulator